LKSQNEIAELLVIDDDDIDVKSIKRALTKLNIANRLVRAKHGKEALDILRGCHDENVVRPYLILLDLNMPVMGGIEFLENIRDDRTLQDSVIIVLTTSSSEEDRVAAYSNHVAGYIVKSDFRDGAESVLSVLSNYIDIVHLPK